MFTGGQAVTGVPSGFSALGDTYVAPNLNLSVLIALVVLVVCAFILVRTRLGRYIYAIGGNSEAARLAGINVQKIQRRVYVIGGVLAAGTGIIIASQLGTGDPASFSGYELTVITAVVLGGIPLSGGQGSVGGTIVGVGILSVLDNGLILLNVSPYASLVVQGLALVVAVGVGQIQWHRRRSSAVLIQPTANEWQVSGQETDEAQSTAVGRG
jgi:ribose transport system permease protein